MEHPTPSPIHDSIRKPMPGGAGLASQGIPSLRTAGGTAAVTHMGLFCSWAGSHQKSEMLACSRILGRRPDSTERTHGTGSESGSSHDNAHGDGVFSIQLPI